jgi:hypothetical protein
VLPVAELGEAAQRVGEHGGLPFGLRDHVRDLALRLGETAVELEPLRLDEPGLRHGHVVPPHQATA